MTRTRSVVSLVGVGLAVAAFLPALSQAATFNVNTTADPATAGDCASPPAQCTLRNAVEAANGDPGSTVNVPAGNYVLNAPDVIGSIGVREDMTIAGAGARSTIVDAGRKSRVFTLGGFESAAPTVTITGLTVTGGLAGVSQEPLSGDGGGILNLGALTLRDVTVTANQAFVGGGGIFTEPPENFELAGGDALSRGAQEEPVSLTLERVTVSNNLVDSEAQGNGQGGGIAAFGPVHATNSTIAGNKVEKTGTQQGGGIVAADGLELLNVTIAGNSLSSAEGFGGGISLDQPIDVRDRQVPAGSLAATNTIVSGNTVGGATEDCALIETVTSVNNLSSDSSCGFDDAGSKRNANPLLADLGNNGGQTDTRGIGPDSPALNAGANTGCPGIDQRGIARPQSAFCDIGAFEFVPPAAVVPQQPQQQTAPAVQRPRRPRIRTAGVRSSCVRRAFGVSVRVNVSSTTSLRTVRVTLDGRTIAQTTKRSFSVTVPARSLSSGRHTLRVRATDRGGRTTVQTQSFRRCARPAQQVRPEMQERQPRFTG